jgi:hypothetical protein
MRDHAHRESALHEERMSLRTPHILARTGRLTRAALLVAATAALAACSAEPVALGAGESLTVGRFTSLESAAAQGTRIDTTQRRTTITDAATWGSFWTSLIPDPQATGPAPTVDFSQEMVIAAVMPLRPSSGYRIEIERVTEYADYIEAEVVERTPAAGCVVLTVITRPFDVIRVPRRNKPVRFVERTLETPCGDGTKAAGDTVRAPFGRATTSHNVSVTLVKVVSDSRCPINALCIWEGDAVVTLRFVVNGQSSDVTLHTSGSAGANSTKLGGTEFRLIGLTPFLVIGPPAPNETDYTAILLADGPSVSGDTVSAPVGRTVTSHGVSVTLTKVESDSRCPINALCIWEGDAVVTLRFAKGGQATDVTLHTSTRIGATSTTFGGTEFRLVGLTPPIVAGQPAPNAADYTAILVAQ